MVNILANRYMIDEDWCFNHFSKIIRSHHKIAILPFAFRDKDIDSLETWHKFYNSIDGIYYHGIVDSFKRYGVDNKNIEILNYFKDTVETLNN